MRNAAKNRFTLLMVAVAALLVLGYATPAEASIQVNFVSVSAGACPCTWTYDAVLLAGEETTLVADGEAFSTQFTLYDINGLIAGSETQPNANWTATSALVGSTPSLQNPPDSGTAPNITWTYGATAPQLGNPQGGANVDLGNFTFMSSVGGPPTLFIFYSQQAAKNTTTTGGGPAADDDQNAQGTSSVLGPAIPSTPQIPEPGTIMLLGSGLVGLGGAVRRRWLGNA